MVSSVVASALELSRWQFATTLFHFIFVPITLGLAPVLAMVRTLAYRRPAEREKWLRLTRLFGVLFPINFATGGVRVDEAEALMLAVATGDLDVPDLTTALERHGAFR